MSNFLEQSRFSPIPPAPSNVKYKAAALMPQPRRLAGEPFRAIAGFPAPAPNLPPPHADSQTKVTQSPKNVKSATIEYTPIFAEGRLGVSNIQPFNRNFCHAISPHSSHWSHESHSPAATLTGDSTTSSAIPIANSNLEPFGRQAYSLLHFIFDPFALARNACVRRRTQKDQASAPLPNEWLRLGLA
jgi:hypothetical protein